MVTAPGSTSAVNYLTNLPHYWGYTDSYIPVLGNWSGSGVKYPGLFDQTQGTWALDTKGLFDGKGNPIYDTFVQWGLPGGNDVPVVGDWTGSGRDDIGVFRQEIHQRP